MTCSLDCDKFPRRRLLGAPQPGFKLLAVLHHLVGVGPYLGQQHQDLLRRLRLVISSINSVTVGRRLLVLFSSNLLRLPLPGLKCSSHRQKVTEQGNVTGGLATAGVAPTPQIRCKLIWTEDIKTILLLQCHRPPFCRQRSQRGARITTHTFQALLFGCMNNRFV